MKTLLNALFFSALAAGSPTRRDASDTSTDMDAVIAGNAECASTAVIFGRGTFDSGNIGVWVGPAFKEALLEEFGGDVHVQGVNEEDYHAELPGYVEGGSESCGDGCARTVDEYAAKCPEANIFISGWRYAPSLSYCIGCYTDEGQPRRPLRLEMRKPH
jgi:cutinase